VDTRQALEKELSKNDYSLRASLGKALGRLRELEKDLYIQH
jgi:hypothetical protein